MPAQRNADGGSAQNKVVVFLNNLGGGSRYRSQSERKTPEAAHFLTYVRERCTASGSGPLFRVLVSHEEVQKQCSYQGITFALHRALYLWCWRWPYHALLGFPSTRLQPLRDTVDRHRLRA